ncbi:MAG: hypothetical protein A3G25_03325 [Betaproteobacteria bacterium RIFCSPLOWO2_12_FULL_63_13]|nr:MAG: hypothetical protein A3H32_08775 [Betaproteobacteria bacterium RIFCSPLOWO2_02_FULL_63_19]OGA52050.1 MAG: hypothetical protein A3G25_03325 [Betaproteobacteria bacterium RIFCSPLOWO2_12_FULL_63_13]
MLLLPLDGSLPDVGCNLAIAEVLLAAIGGVSAVLYATEGGTGAAFQGFLRGYYPWDAEPDRENPVRDPTEGARILYMEYRNPLAHAAGVSVFSEGFGKDAQRVYRPREHGLMIRRIAIADDARPGRGLTEHRLLELESEPARPGWLSATLASDGSTRILTVEALYWGFRAAVRRLCGDAAKMDEAKRFFGVR